MEDAEGPYDQAMELQVVDATIALPRTGKPLAHKQGLQQGCRDPWCRAMPTATTPEKEHCPRRAFSRRVLTNYVIAQTEAPPLTSHFWCAVAVLLFCPTCGNMLIVEEGQKYYRFACKMCQTSLRK
ncbi:hypothetical protein NDU88_002862 [Pleurodeles waltl]|uniref:DNA-directed RNA polymerase II subunit RPB9-like zinc ribbon domain-containing protein n=1 Tax=Pleurodeles waltl TaxID=8319 RepID=A0AAV7NEV9_PLEWA|nr:hypothetical protein NDU88_002862 [Pleurodeles waltl]